jgi:hypothetical protein
MNRIRSLYCRRFVLDFQKFALGTLMSPKLKGRSFWFDAELVMSGWIETSVLSDIPAVITDFRVLFDFQTLLFMIWSCSVLRAQETGFDGSKSGF